MTIRSRSSGLILVRTLAWRQLTQRFSFLFFMLLATSFLVLEKTNTSVIEHLRSSMVDGLVPVFEIVASPMTFVHKVSSNYTNLIALRDENDRLKNQLNQLKEWQNATQVLDDQNKELKRLLNFKTEPGVAYITARVIADTGAPYIRGMIITAGSQDGVHEGMAVMTGDGLIGRVVEVGDWSSRVLLITDLNSRIPVTLLGSGDRAILTGDNSSSPRLQFLPDDTTAHTGMPVVTSGHGGVFPPNLPVGTVLDTGHHSFVVLPIADISRINFVRLIDFSLKGGVFNPMLTKVDADKKKR